MAIVRPRPRLPCQNVKWLEILLLIAMKFIVSALVFFMHQSHTISMKDQCQNDIQTSLAFESIDLKIS